MAYSSNLGFKSKLDPPFFEVELWGRRVFFSLWIRAIATRFFPTDSPHTLISARPLRSMIAEYLGSGLVYMLGVLRVVNDIVQWEFRPTHPVAFVSFTRSMQRETQAPVIDIQPTTRSSLPVAVPLTPPPRAYAPEILVSVETQLPYSQALPGLGLYDVAISPTSTAPPTALNSRAPSPTFDSVGTGHLSFDSLKWRLASGYFACFVIGWADGVTGTVMPCEPHFHSDEFHSLLTRLGGSTDLAAEFHLTTMTSSLLWAGTTCGFFIGTFLLEIILRWLGRFSLEPSKKSIVPHTLAIFKKNRPASGHSATQARHSTLLIASVLHAFYFIMMGSRGGFPVMFVAYAMAAFSRALLTDYLSNAYFASGPKQALGFGYGIASFGSVASPLVCQFVIAAGVPWFHFYYGSLVLSAINIALLAVTFKPSLAELTKEHQKTLRETRSGLGTTDGAAQTGGLNTEKIPSSVVSPTSSVLRLKLENSNKSNTRLQLRVLYVVSLAYNLEIREH
ncbi:hypothetical protein D9756_004248 [Leucocoprinus leucothites]|uniref:Uncharacterized protein n=1 Tax=Leucocoprinus leucothites TaxID=201217 RepID=A0A8H5DAZ2_9AGAR|nr:hypothetical protein D9756_004248 [Leucoagaricus leucothites]